MTRQRKKRPQNRPKPSQTPAKRQEPDKHDGGATQGPSSRLVHYSESSTTAIPPPSMLAAYNNVVENAGERILAMAEQQQTHRHELEATVIKGDTRRANHGLYIGGAIIIAALICGTYLVANDKDAQGMFLGMSGLVTALGAFFWGWRKRQKEVEELRRS